MELQEVLNACYVDSSNPNLVMLPEGKLERKTYEEVAKRLEGIGGKWTRKAGGFIFSHNPTELLAQVQGGAEINLKKEFQFFATPPELADYLVELAEIDNTDWVLEPSAGQGAIIEAIRRAAPTCMITAVELMKENFEVLKNKHGGDELLEMHELDFFEYKKYVGKSVAPTVGNAVPPKKGFDVIIANPPFSKNQDIDHVLAMYDVLAYRGRLVSVTSTHWERSLRKKEADFKRFLEQVGAEIYDIEAGTFAESGTQVGGKIVVIDK